MKMAKKISGMYRCLGCGKLFDADDVKAVQESRGEFWGDALHRNNVL